LSVAVSEGGETESFATRTTPYNIREPNFALHGCDSASHSTVRGWVSDMQTSVVIPQDRLQFRGDFQQTWGSQNESAAHRTLLTLCGFW
jgi:hypothetical protein